MSDKASVLLIAYKFPPYSLVGAFRWTRLSKHLAKLGHRIDVVTVDWKMKDISNLVDQVAGANITIHRIRSGYPHNLKLKRFQNRWLNMLKNRVFRWVIDRYIYWDDEAQHWGRYLIPACESLLREKSIRVVIATGSPFQANVWAAELKRRNPGISLVQDLRDPWVRDPVLHYRDMPAALAMEYETLSTADQLVVVSNGMKRHFAENAREGMPIAVINNGHDISVSPRRVKAAHRNGVPLRIVYVGGLSCGREEILRAALDAVVAGRIQGLQWVLVGNIPSGLALRYPALIEAGLLEIRGWVSQEQVGQLLAEADYALQVNSEIYPYALSTKVFEYAALHVPCISLNYGGDIEDVINEGSFGYSVNLARDDLMEFLKRLEAGGTEENFTFNIEPYSYTRLAAIYSSLIETLVAVGLERKEGVGS